jgi:RecA/RadA recombinase
MAKDFFKTFVDDLGDPDTAIAAEGKSAAEFSGYIDTGSYVLNAALSGTIFGGLPNNKAVVFGGDPATGKTFFALGVVKKWLEENKDGRVFYFDTESAVTNDMMISRGIDPKRVAKSEPDSLESFRNTAVKLLDKYAELPVSDRFPLLMVLDSLSMLPSRKEIADVVDDKDTKDMTKPGVIKGTFRLIRLKLAKVQVPLIITNHVYAQIGAYMPTKTMAGGSGAQYASDTIVMLSKKQEKVGDEIVGIVVHVHVKKSRLSRENTKVDVRILFNGGLDRYYGLLDYAVEAGLIKKVSTRYELPDGSKVFEKQILAKPETVFTQELLEKLDEYMKPKFTYTASAVTEASDDSEE